MHAYCGKSMFSVETHIMVSYKPDSVLGGVYIVS